MDKRLVKTKGICRFSGKRRYATKISAQVVMGNIRSIHPSLKDPTRPLPIRVYHCPVCKDYHLTSKPYRPKPKNRPLAPEELVKSLQARAHRDFPLSLTNLQLKEMFDQACFDHRQDTQTVNLLWGAYQDWLENKSNSQDSTRQIFKMLVLATYDQETWEHTTVNRGYWLEEGMEEYARSLHPHQKAHQVMRRLEAQQEGKVRHYLQVPYAQAGPDGKLQILPLDDTEAGPGQLNLSISIPVMPRRTQRQVLLLFSPQKEPNFHGAPAYLPQALIEEEGLVLVQVPCPWHPLDTLAGLLGFTRASTLEQARLALDWVHENVVYFDGAPSRISLMGEGPAGRLLIDLLATQAEDEKTRVKRAVLSASPRPRELKTLAGRVDLLLGLGQARESWGLLCKLPAGLGAKAGQLLDRLEEQQAARFLTNYRQAGGSVHCYRLEEPEGQSLTGLLLADHSQLGGRPGTADPVGREQNQARALRSIWAGFLRTGNLDRRFYKQARFREVLTDR